MECATFDELGADVLKEADLPAALLNQVMMGRPTPRLVPVQLPTVEARAFPILRYSALLLRKIPRIARKITLTTSTTSPAVRSILKEKRCRAIVAANGLDLAVFGNDQEILAALAPLGAKISGEVELDPSRDSWALGLLYDALAKSLSRRPPLIPRLKRSGHSLVVAPPRDGDDEERSRRDAHALATLRNAYGADLTGKVPKLHFPFQEGVFLKLEQIDGSWWCGFEPYTFVEIPRTESFERRDPKEAKLANSEPMNSSAGLGGDPAGDWRRERWAQKYNKNWANIIDAWAHLLTSTENGEVRAFGLDAGTGIDAVFEISQVTGWSRPGHHHAYFDRRK